MSELTGQEQIGRDAATPVPAGEPTARAKTIFVSYARQDQDKARQIVDGLRMLDHSVWFDEGLVGGQEWWDEILMRIRDCDIFIQAVSGHATRSAACDSERQYAIALKKKLLPVMLERIPGASLPGDLAGLQFIDFVDATPASAFKLARSVDGAPTAPALPNPLPEPPHAPLSYLVALGDKVRSQDSLALDDQLAIVGTIRTALGHPEDIDGVDDLDATERLLRDLRNRRDAYHRVAEEVGQALTQLEAVRREITPTPVAEAEPKHTATVAPTLVRETDAQTVPVVAPKPSPATSMSATQEEVKPHWVMAVVSAFLFLLLGIFAIINAARVRPALKRGDVAAAKKASGRVKLYFWITIGIAIGLFLLFMIIGLTHPSNSS